MRPGTGSSEWPLVAFTLSTQAAAGACLVDAGLRWASCGPYVFRTGEVLTGPVPVVALALLAAGGLAAFPHLGQPGAARLALSNVRSSWLSREVALGLAFGGAVAVHLALRQVGLGTPVVREISGAVAALLGAGLVFAISRLYRLRTVPAWDTPATPLAFFGSALVLGAVVVVGVAVAVDLEKAGLRAPGALAAVATAGQILLLGLHVRRLRALGGAAAVSAATVVETHRTALVLRVVLGVVGAALLLAVTWSPGGVPHPVPVATAAVLIAVAETLGRHLFYRSHRRVGL